MQISVICEKKPQAFFMSVPAMVFTSCRASETNSTPLAVTVSSRDWSQTQVHVYRPDLRGQLAVVWHYTGLTPSGKKIPYKCNSRLACFYLHT